MNSVVAFLAYEKAYLQNIAKGKSIYEMPKAK